MSKIYSKKYAEKLIREGRAVKTSTVTNDGKQYQAIDRLDTQEIAHYKLPTKHRKQSLMNTSKYIKMKSLEAAKANAHEGTRFIHTASVMDDCGAGGFCGFYATPDEEREYNEGMARMADMG